MSSMATPDRDTQVMSSDPSPSRSMARNASGERAPLSSASRMSYKESSPANYGSKPLARAVLVCKRCRSKKIKCDQVFPACGSCVKANEPCVGIDSATGREVSRSYIVDLEQQVQDLRQQKAELEHRLLVSASTSNAGQKRSLDVVKTEDLHSANNHVQADGPPQKRSMRLNEELTQPYVTSVHPEVVLKAMAPTPEPDSAYAVRPMLGRSNSRISGLSPARLLCQAIRQSAQAGLHNRDPASRSKLRALNTDHEAKRQLDFRSKLFLQSASLENSSNEHQDYKHIRNATEADGLRVEARADSSSSRSITPLDERKQSPYDEGDMMQYANTTETGDITVPAPEQLSKPSPSPAPFPPLSIARKLVDAYFERVNPQLPILERSTFMPRFERACQKALEKAIAKLPPDAQQDALDNKDCIEIEPEYADGHLFHLVFAIAAAMGWTRSKWSAENHHEAAMRFLDPRRNKGAGSDSGVGAIMGRDSLEQLQCLLLTALYSIMRPMKPGVWYCLGVALRLTTGLGLYSESPGLLEATNGGSSTDPAETLLEKKRRLFWCSYALDRQVCVHLGRPFGIADSDVKVDLPWLDCDDQHYTSSLDNGTRMANEQDVNFMTEQARREAASTLAGLQGTTELQTSLSACFAARPKDASRWVSLSFFRMRILQSEIQSILHQNAELPRRFHSYEHWKADMLQRLRSWRSFAPNSKTELEAKGCDYNPIFLELNYQQTLLMVYGLSPRFPNASRTDLACVEACSRNIITMYSTLSKEGQMNYTWMTGHNVFLACTSYLYAIWQINAIDPSSFPLTLTQGFANKVAEIKHFASACDKVLASLQWATAEKCRKCLRAMFYATSVVIDKYSSTRTNQGRLQIDTTAALAGQAAFPSNTHPSTNIPNGSTTRADASYAEPQARDWGEKGVEPVPTSDVPEQHQIWSERSVDTRSKSAGFRPDVQNLIHMASAHWHDEEYHSDGATLTHAVEPHAAVAEALCTTKDRNTTDVHVSPRSFLPDSPSNLDISSLMAASAMELDALFREAGLTAGPSNVGYSGNPLHRLDGDAKEWLTDHALRVRHESHAPYLQHGPALSGNTDNAHAGPLMYTQGAELQASAATPHAHRAPCEGLDTDWEALGFGYRLGEHSSLSDSAQSYVQENRPGPTNYTNMRQASGSAAEFDYRLLDSHMGF